MMKKILSSLLIGSLLISSSLFQTESAAEEPVVDEIPNTSRVEKAYDESFLSVTGFAADGVNDRSEYVDTSYYREVNDPREFLQALLDAEEGDVKVIEVMEDLNFGWKNIALTPEEEDEFNLIKEGDEPTTSITNPLIRDDGVSEIEIGNIDGLTIFSASGKTIKHAEFKIQDSANDIVIRNLSFDGMWQWDDSGRHKEVGWAFINISGATNIWIDHCKFTIAADGLVDLKNGANNISLTWNEFGLPADKDPEPGSSIYESIHFMEEQYEAGELPEISVYYLMREGGATPEDIMAYTAYHSKVHLSGSGDKDYVDYVRGNGEVVKDSNHHVNITMAYNQYTNVGQRLPMVRQGMGHIFNNYFDNSSHYEIMDDVPAIAEHGRYTLSRGINSRNGASIAGDTNVYYGFNEPITGAEVQGDDTNNMNEPWDVLFQNAKNHFLVVNSMITNTDGETYTGSSWDNNGDNLFTKGVTWDDKSTIGEWAWSSAIDGREDMDKENPPTEPFTFTYDYDKQLPYEYQIVPLDEVESTVQEYAGIAKVDLSIEEWLQTDYADADGTNDATPGNENSNVQDNEQTSADKDADKESNHTVLIVSIIGAVVLIILIAVLVMRGRKN